MEKINSFKNENDYKYNIRSFVKGNFLIACPTEIEAITLMKFISSFKGIVVWGDNSLVTDKDSHWSVFTSYTVYSCSDNTLGIASCSSFMESDHLDIVLFREIESKFLEENPEEVKEDLLEEEKYTFGLIKGRHPLPVQNYIIEEKDVKCYTKEELLPLIKDGLCRYGINLDSWGYGIIIHLYITGLTIATLTAVAYLQKLHYKVAIYGFNPITQEYYLQGIF